LLGKLCSFFNFYTFKQPINFQHIPKSQKQPAVFFAPLPCLRLPKWKVGGGG